MVSKNVLSVCSSNTGVYKDVNLMLYYLFVSSVVFICNLNCICLLLLYNIIYKFNITIDICASFMFCIRFCLTVYLRSLT